MTWFATAYAAAVKFDGIVQRFSVAHPDVPLSWISGRLQQLYAESAIVDWRAALDQAEQELLNEI